MADYYGTVASNAFAVKDFNAFAEWLEQLAFLTKIGGSSQLIKTTYEL